MSVLITEPSSYVQMKLIDLMGEAFSNGLVTMDYPHLGVEAGYDDDGNKAMFLKRDVTKIDFPAIVVHTEGDAGENMWIGAFVGPETRAEMYGVDVWFDVWGENSKQRDQACNLIDNLLFRNRWNLYDLGMIDIRKVRTQHRGFDWTDRILQYESHAIIHIRRRLLCYHVEFEHKQPIDASSVHTIEKIVTTVYGEQMILGKIQLPQLLLEDLANHNLV